MGGVDPKVETVTVVVGEIETLGLAVVEPEKTRPGTVNKSMV